MLLGLANFTCQWGNTAGVKRLTFQLSLTDWMICARVVTCLVTLTVDIVIRVKPIVYRQFMTNQPHNPTNPSRQTTGFKPFSVQMQESQLRSTFPVGASSLGAAILWGMIETPFREIRILFKLSQNEVDSQLLSFAGSNRANKAQHIMLQT